MERMFTNLEVPKRSFQYFARLKNNKELCDVTFQVGNESISAHSIIITAAIPYLRDLLIGKDTQNDVAGIRTPDIEPNAFKCMIEYAYTYQVKINTSNVRNLLTAAIYLRVDEVLAACCDFVADSLKPDHVSNILELACQLNCTQLLITIVSYVKENFQEISETDDFLSFPSTFVKELISKDDLNVDDERTVFEAALKWVKNSPETRKSELPDLIRRIRMTLIEPAHLSKIAVKEELLRTSLLCRDLLDEAKDYNLYPELRTGVCSFNTEPRHSMKATCVSKEKEANLRLYKLEAELKLRVQHLNLIENEWHTEKYKTFYLNSASVVEVQNKMYFIHWGYNIEYDPVQNMYKSLSHVPTPAAFKGAACLNNNIYVCGGQIGGNVYNIVDCFNPQKNEWKSVCPMQTCRYGASVVAFRGCIFVLGGRNSSCTLDSVERYNPETDRWNTVSPLLTKRSHAGATVLHGKIYVCGGNISPDGIKGITAVSEVYDPEKNRWNYISSMNTARWQFKLLTYCGKLYVVGGTGISDTRVFNFDVYDPESGAWTRIQPTGTTTLLTSGAVLLATTKV